MVEHQGAAAGRLARTTCHTPGASCAPDGIAAASSRNACCHRDSRITGPLLMAQQSRSLDANTSTLSGSQENGNQASVVRAFHKSRPLPAAPWTKRPPLCRSGTVGPPNGFVNIASILTRLPNEGRVIARVCFRWRVERPTRFRGVEDLPPLQVGIGPLPAHEHGACAVVVCASNMRRGAQAAATHRFLGQETRAWIARLHGLLHVFSWKLRVVSVRRAGPLMP
jgi:hypothetical protein